MAISIDMKKAFHTVLKGVVTGFLYVNLNDISKAVALADGCDGLLSSVSFNEKDPKDICRVLKQAIESVMDMDSVEMSFENLDATKEAIFSEKNYLRFFFRTDSKVKVREIITAALENDPETDSRTFPMEDVIDQVFDAVTTTASSSPELSSIASFLYLQNLVQQKQVYTANKLYVDSFTEPLFLHRDIPDTKVNLENLFLCQKFSIVKSFSTEFDGTGLEDYLMFFINKTEEPVLFIEGDAGSGKTSLMAWLNFHYSEYDDISEKVMGTRPLITIRLRDLDQESISKTNGLSSAIRQYMNVESLDEMERLFPNAVMILDGFDELCMINGLDISHEQLLYDWFRKELKGYKFIVTTRPKFIRYNDEIPSGIVAIEHYNIELRKKWLERFTSEEYCNQLVNDEVSRCIEEIDDSSISSICDTPLTLYMLASDKEAVLYLNNPWQLYHHIFSKALSETEYNKMFPNPDRNNSHPIQRYSDVLYQISEEIAYELFRSNNTHLYITNDRVDEIIRNLAGQHPILAKIDVQDTIKRCYALCGYWKANSDKGVVEFLHNNIRDFFLAEKIYRGINHICAKEPYIDTYGLVISEAWCQSVKDAIEEYLFCGEINEKVCEFIFYRALYEKKNSIDSQRENMFQSHPLRTVIVANNSHLLLSIRNYSSPSKSILLSSENDFDEFGIKLDPFSCLTNCYINLIRIIRTLFEVYSEEDRYIEWTLPFWGIRWERFPIKAIFSGIPVTLSYDRMITWASRGDFKGFCFEKQDLRNIGFQNSLLSKADFSDCILCGCDFSEAILTGADFQNADVHFASLEKANLENCNFTGADLRGTTLPDGFESADQNETVEHLRSLQITGLIV